MTIEKSSVTIDGFFVQTYCFLPSSKPKKVALLFHGQGDFILRYKELVQQFVDKGIAVIGADLPGHGSSSGKRGDIPSIKFINTLVQQLKQISIAKFSQPAQGLIGHSMGGFLALNELNRYHHEYEFAFINAPLLRPDRNKSTLELYLLKKLSLLFPKFTVSTGVKPNACRQENSDNLKKSEQTDDELQFHSRISLRWGHELLEQTPKLQQELKKCVLNTHVLITQGAEDTITPLKYTQEFIHSVSWGNLTFKELSDELHEPFQDVNKSDFFVLIRNWLNTLEFL